MPEPALPQPSVCGSLFIRHVVSRPAQWMSGSGVHIFSIMITGMAIYNPVKSAVTVNTGALSPALMGPAGTCGIPCGRMCCTHAL